MLTRYCQHQYKCTGKNCGAITNHFTWTDKVKTTTHTCTCGSTLTLANLHIERKPAAPAIRTPTKNR